MRLTDVFARILKQPAEGFTDDANKDTVVDWTSMAHVALLVELEREYDVRFSNAEMATMRSVGDIRTALAGKGVQPS